MITVSATIDIKDTIRTAVDPNTFRKLSDETIFFLQGDVEFVFTVVDNKVAFNLTTIGAANLLLSIKKAADPDGEQLVLSSNTVISGGDSEIATFTADTATVEMEEYLGGFLNQPVLVELVDNTDTASPQSMAQIRMSAINRGFDGPASLPVYANLKHKITEDPDRIPNADDDSLAGFGLGSIWLYFNLATPTEPGIFINKISTAGAAEWVDLLGMSATVWGGIGGNLPDQTDLFNYVRAQGNFFEVDAALPAIDDKRFQSYADAVTYIQANFTPGFFNRFIVRIYGAMPENSPVLEPWIYPAGFEGDTGLVSTGNWTNAGTGAVAHSDAYQMFNLSTGGVDPAAGTTIRPIDCRLNDQETTTGSGSIWMSGSNMFDGDNNADLSSCALILDKGSVATIQLGGDITMYDAFLLVKGITIKSLQHYAPGGQVLFGANTTITDFFFGLSSEFYGANLSLFNLMSVNMAAQTMSGEQLHDVIKKLVTVPSLSSLRTLTIAGGTGNQIENSIIYNLDIVVDGATTVLETVGSIAGLGTETITEANGGTATARGDIGVLNLSGGTMSGVLNMGNNGIFDVGAYTGITATYTGGVVAQLFNGVPLTIAGSAANSLREDGTYASAADDAPVQSVHGRTGDVVSAAGDYAASQNTNDSPVAGAFVDDALVTLDDAIKAVQAGASPKASVRLASQSDGNISLTGLLTIDGVVSVAGDRIGVTAQTDPIDNGVYIAAVGAWTRSTDFDGDDEVKDGVYFRVIEGTNHQNHVFMVISSGDVDVGVDPITFDEHADIGFGTTAGTATEGNDSRVPTQSENDALVGTNGTPSTSNKFVTNSDPRNSDARTPTAHALGGAEHSADTLANLNNKVSDATLDTNTASRPPNGAAGGDLTGTFPNPTIGNSKVSFAKIVDVASPSIVGRQTGGAGVQEVLTMADARSILDVYTKAEVDGLVVSGLTTTTINGQEILTLIDTTRSNKVLSSAEMAYLYSEQILADDDWIAIGTVLDADAGYVIPMDATVVRVGVWCDNDNGNAKEIDLYIDGVLNSTIFTMPGLSAEVQDQVTDLDINIAQGEKIGLRAGTTGGSIADTIITLYLKWRG